MRMILKKRSFAISTEGYSKLEEIKELKNLKTLAEAVRFSIDFCYDRLLLDTDLLLSDELLNVVQKNNILLRVLLIEIVKSHNGSSKSLSESGRGYLKNLHAEISTYMESHNIEVNP